jgi:CRP-like cAMP-binding protein
MESLEHILAEHPFFQGLQEEHLHVINGCASNIRFDPEHYLFREGEPADRFYIIRQGKIAVEIYAEQKGKIIIDTLGEGEVLGWSWLIPPYSWHFDARTLEMTRAIALDGKCLRTKCENDPALGYEIMKRFADIMEQRLQATRLRLLDLYGK